MGVQRVGEEQAWRARFARSAQRGASAEGNCPGGEQPEREPGAARNRGDGATSRRDEPEETTGDVATAFGAPEWVRGVAVDRRYLRVGVAGAHGAAPVLVEAIHGEIMAGHGLGDVEDAIAALAHAAAHLRFFASDEVFVVAIHIDESIAANEGIAAEVERKAGLRVPVEIEERVVDGVGGAHLAAIPEDAGDRGIVEAVEIVADEAGIEERVAIEEKDERSRGLGPTGVAGAGGASGAVENDGADAEILREGDRVVGGGRVDVEDVEEVARVVHGEHAGEAGAQAPAFVAADDDDSNARKLD
jgi:hypothetical protein